MNFITVRSLPSTIRAHQRNNHVNRLPRRTIHANDENDDAPIVDFKYDSRNVQFECQVQWAHCIADIRLFYQHDVYECGIWRCAGINYPSRK